MIWAMHDFTCIILSMLKVSALKVLLYGVAIAARNAASYISNKESHAGNIMLFAGKLCWVCVSQKLNAICGELHR